jgi:hypothetical protein
MSFCVYSDVASFLPIFNDGFQINPRQIFLQKLAIPITGKLIQETKINQVKNSHIALALQKKLFPHILEIREMTTNGHVCLKVLSSEF